MPALDAEGLIEALPELAAVPRARAAENVLSLPGPQITQAARAAAGHARGRRVARAGEGVVVTTGTDTLEELAMLDRADVRR